VIVPGGFFTPASVALSVSTTLHLDAGKTVPATASFRQQAGRGANAKTLLKAGIKSIATNLANQLLRATTGAKHVRSEISAMATLACVMGFLGLIPYVGLVFGAIALIAMIITLVYNGGRAKKVGMIRVGLGIGASLIGALITVIMINMGR
jgi:hypothetical protein